MAPLSLDTIPGDASEVVSVDWSTMSYLMDDDDDDDESLLFINPNSYDTKARKRVRIAPEPQVLDYVEPLSEMSSTERIQGWWQKEEYEATKAAAKTKCRELRRNGNAKQCLVAAYEQACKAAEEEEETNRESSQGNLNPDSVRWTFSKKTRPVFLFFSDSCILFTLIEIGSLVFQCGVASWFGALVVQVAWFVARQACE